MLNLSYYAYYSVYEGLEVASGSSALPAAEDNLEQPTSPSMVSDGVEEFLLTPSKVRKLPYP